MSTLYSRSAVMLAQAKYTLKMVSEDDAYLDIACFDTQQAIELLIKAILFENDVFFGKTHNIRYLSALLDEIEFAFDKRDTLDSLADTITDWEESGLYGKGVKTTVQAVQRAHDIYESMNKAFIASQEQNNNDTGEQSSGLPGNIPEASLRT